MIGFSLVLLAPSHRLSSGLHTFACHSRFSVICHLDVTYYYALARTKNPNSCAILYNYFMFFRISIVLHDFRCALLRSHRMPSRSNLRSQNHDCRLLFSLASQTCFYALCVIRLPSYRFVAFLHRFQIRS